MNDSNTINVYGTGINALKWVLDNSDIKIKYFIETKKTKTSFLGCEVIQAEDNIKKLKNNYTVVATSGDVYWEIKRYLETELGLVEFENFEYMTTYNKKIAVIYGNCHALAVKKVFEQIPQMQNIYGFYPLKPIYEISDASELELPVFGNAHYLFTKVLDKTIAMVKSLLLVI